MPAAIEHHEQALGISREAGDRRAEGIDLSNLGSAHSMLGHCEEAIAGYRQALAIAEETDYQTGKVHRLVGLGDCCLAQGRMADASAFYAQAYAIGESLNDAQITHMLDLTRGLALSIIEGKDEAALSVLAKVLRVAEDQEDADDLVADHIAMSIILWACELGAEAVAALEQALAIATASGYGADQTLMEGLLPLFGPDQDRSEAARQIRSYLEGDWHELPMAPAVRAALRTLAGRVLAAGGTA